MEEGSRQATHEGAVLNTDECQPLFKHWVPPQLSPHLFQLYKSLYHSIHLFHHPPTLYFLKVTSLTALLRDAYFFFSFPLQFFHHYELYVCLHLHLSAFCLYYSPLSGFLPPSVNYGCFLIPAEYFMSTFLVRAVKLRRALEKLVSSPVIGKSCRNKWLPRETA